MNKICTGLLLIVSSLFLFSTVAVSGSGAVNKIRSLYYNVEKNISKFKKISVMKNEFDVYTAWVDGKEVKKVEITVPDLWEDNAMHRVKSCYYYHKNRLFFIFASTEKLDKSRQSVVMRMEERIYIDGSRIVKALVRKTDNDSFENIPNENYLSLFKNRKQMKRFLNEGNNALSAVESDL